MYPLQYLNYERGGSEMRARTALRGSQALLVAPPTLVTSNQVACCLVMARPTVLGTPISGNTVSGHLLIAHHGYK